MSCHDGSFARADTLALLLFLHVEAEEFERLVAIDPAVPRMRVEQKDVIGLVVDFAVLFAILVVQGHLASAANDVKNVSLFRRSLVNGDRAVADLTRSAGGVPPSGAFLYMRLAQPGGLTLGFSSINEYFWKVFTQRRQTVIQ